MLVGVDAVQAESLTPPEERMSVPDDRASKIVCGSLSQAVRKRCLNRPIHEG